MGGRAALCGTWGRCPASRPGALAAPGRARRGSGCRPGLRAARSLQGEERVRDRDERDVVVPAAIGAALEVVQSEGVLELAVVVLDPPAHLPQPHEVLQRRLDGEVGEPVLGRLALLRWPLAEQPADRELPPRSVGVVAQLDVRRTNPEREETRAHLAAGARAPSDRLSGLLARGERQRLQRGGILAIARLGRPAHALPLWTLGLDVLAVGGGGALGVQYVGE